MAIDSVQQQAPAFFVLTTRVAPKYQGTTCHFKGT